MDGWMTDVYFSSRAFSVSANSFRVVLGAEANNASQCSFAAFEASGQSSLFQVTLFVVDKNRFQCICFSGLQQQSTSLCCRHIFTIQHRLVGGQRQATQVFL